ncbi:MAG: type II toxin-antitoxin system RelE/ParE family toxin [Eubacterium sp.]|nr:type II toxin-antitoxin system RelE/ParE family toxin [Eubacterium sp.]MCI9412655.1 type II toxin-antitoxin system RelE/ParE family toxin [Eubacterium sp.]
MNYKIVFQKAAIKFLKKQDKKTQERLLTTINQLPQGTDIKKLKGLDMYRMRVGNMRILYTIDDSIKIISIENIDNRGDVYKRY